MIRAACNIINLFFFTALHYASGYGQTGLYPNTFPSGDVTLLNGPFRHARDLNIRVLLNYETDRLLAPYRKEAGLLPKDSGYRNWDGLDGHIGGHYLSALAMNYAATGNAECKKRMEYMIAELRICQEANKRNNTEWGIGYAGGVPNSKSIWPALRYGDFKPYRAGWVPWYNVHKMFAGLRDAWLYAGNRDAKEVFIRFCNWAISITAALTDEQMQTMLEVEHGGMNEIFADAFQVTGDAKYLSAAKRFSHRALLDAMAAANDNLDNRHANTQVPKAVGFQRIGEISKDENYMKAGCFFWETVTANRSLAFGGNSRREFFPAIAACSDFINDVEGPESCNSYNMLKLTESLFRSASLAKYADYYERTLYNHILSTQHPEHGGYVYFTPVRPRHYRVYSAPNQAMWCCVGSGMENHGKYNQFIYTHRHDSLYINLFIASELNWRERGVQVRQETSFPDEEKTRLVISGKASAFKLMIRYPSWVSDGALKIFVNGKPVSHSAQPSSYVMLNRLWNTGDIVEVIMPMRNTIEHLPHVPAYIALMHGPILLAARAGTEDLAGLIAGDNRWGHIASGKRLPVDKAPVIVEEEIAKLAEKLVAIKEKPFHYSLSGLKVLHSGNEVLEPFYKIHDARYMIYWMALTNAQYKSYLDSLSVIENKKLELQKRTIDFVAAGEQQPEADHSMQQANSFTGNYLNEFWRDARNGGFFSYQLVTNGETELALVLRFWGAEWGDRKFNIYIDDELLLTENNSGRWNQSKFIDVTYALPVTMLQGKKEIRIKFQALPGNTAGAVYNIRLVKKSKEVD